MPNALDGQLSSTWYCGPECQKAHWTEHKLKCKASQARQVLYRAAATVEKIHYAFQKITFLWGPGRIEKTGTTWLIHPKVYTGTSRLNPFPYDIFPDKHDQEALLTHRQCMTALSDMHDVVKVLFRGLYSNIDEVSHRVKNAKHYLKSVYPGLGPFLVIDGTDYEHRVIRMTTKSGEIYALDMTGAQYGWDEGIIPWELYTNSRVREILEVVPFGETKVICKTRAKESSTDQQCAEMIKKNFSQAVDFAIAGWQRDNIPSIDLLRLPEHEFQRKQNTLLEAVEGSMQILKAFMEKEGRLEVKGGFQHGVFDTKSTGFALGAIPGRRSPSSGMS